MVLKAQGSMEYLVIIGIVIVIGLSVVFLMSDFISPEGAVSSSGLGIKASNISIAYPVIDSSDSNFFFSLKNNNSGPITVTGVSIDGADANYNEQLFFGEERIFVVPGAEICEAGQKVAARMTVYYLSENNLGNSNVYETVFFGCEDYVAIREADLAQRAALPPDTTAPVVLLMAPADNNVWRGSYTAAFDFNVSDASGISSCSLKVNGADVNTLSSVSKNVQQTIRYTFPQDALADWNISCTDASSNSMTAAKRSIRIDANAYQILTCLELQDMNLDLAGNYALLGNVDCSDTINWNGGAGFEPIGKMLAADQNFRGSFDGNNYAISGLYIYRPTSDYVGLFGYARNSTIRNVGVVDHNYKGQAAVAGLVALNYGGTISNVYASGRISGGKGSDSAGAGGIVGLNDSGGRISNSYAAGDINGGYYVGGLVGNNLSGNISNSYSSADLNGVYYVGGLVGFSMAGTISNSYATGDANGLYGGVGGLIGWNMNGSTVINSYANGSVRALTGSLSHTGGLIGTNAGVVKYSYASSVITGGNVLYSGGFIGRADAGSSLTNCYWDVTLTTETDCCGDEVCASCYGANSSGLETTRWYPQASLGDDYNVPMQHNASSAYDWTFGTDMNWTKRTNNYPVLEWQS